MFWQKLFAPHILERGYDYYCNEAVENLEVSMDSIRADVIGTEDYEVEISLNNEDIIDMYCSCPYADSGKNCKHMAAVLYEWEEIKAKDKSLSQNRDVDKDLFINSHTINGYMKKMKAVSNLVEEADINVVRSYLSSILVENERLLLNFNSIVNKQITEDDIKYYIRQVDNIVTNYLGRTGFISYYESDDFISELEVIIDNDICPMINNENYMSAFKLMNYIFQVISDVAMDDSNGGTGMLADRIYELWVELLLKVSEDEKQEMFHWFTAHLDGSIIDYLEEYIERIIIEEFEEKKYE